MFTMLIEYITNVRDRGSGGLSRNLQIPALTIPSGPREADSVQIFSMKTPPINFLTPVLYICFLQGEALLCSISFCSDLPAAVKRHSIGKVSRKIQLFYLSTGNLLRESHNKTPLGMEAKT